MPVLTGTVGRLGLVIPVVFMQSPQFVTALKKAALPFSPPVHGDGLIDTGASISAIDRSLVVRLGLQARNSVLIHTPSSGPGGDIRNQYDISITLGDGDPNPLSLVLPVIESEFTSQGFDALIGRDILRHCELYYHGGQNIFTLSFNVSP